jgi:hypothetical protein
VGIKTKEMSTNEMVQDLSKRIQGGERPDLRGLSNFISQTVTLVDPLYWEEFRTTVCELYGLTDYAFRERFKQPVFFRKGTYLDTFSPLMQRAKITGFFSRYVAHLVNTESPAAFHFASALTILGAGCKRRIWFDQKIFKIWPCVQTLILGPSGRVAKTTATSYAIEMADSADVIDKMADEITPEALKQELSMRTDKDGEAVGLIYASELGLLFSKQDSYNQGLIQSLTDLFDSRNSSKKQTKTAGTYELKNIAVSFLACSNEGWATMAIPEHALGGGLIGRTLTFYQGGTDKKIPFPTFPDPEERQHLIKMLQLIPLVQGEFYLEKEAKKWYTAKYNWIKDNYPEDERLDPQWTRYGVHLLRIGMLMRVNEIISEAYERKVAVGALPREISVQNLVQADEVLMWIFHHVPLVYQFLGISKHGMDAQKILRYVARQGGTVTHSELSRAMTKHMSMKTMRDYVVGLIEAKALKEVALPKPHFDGKVGYKLIRRLEEM